MPTVEQTCSRCGGQGKMGFGEAVSGSRLTWWASVHCEACGLASEMDGEGRLPDELRAPVLVRSGVWSVHVTPLDRMATIHALKQLLSLSLAEASRLAKTLPGTIARDMTQAEAIALANGVPKEKASVAVRCDQAGEASSAEEALSPLRTERTVVNCEARKEMRCPRTWGRLRETGSPDVRRCGECGLDVFFCSTDAETLGHARKGHRVARDQPHSSELPSFQVTASNVTPVYTGKEERALAWIRREQGIATLLDGRLGHEARDCPECGYPVPMFRRSCFVCGCSSGRS